MVIHVVNLPQIIIDAKVRGYCTLPYPGHPRGCPMFGRRPECPPEAPMFDEYFDMTQRFRAVVCEFDLAGHAARIKAKHPHWTQRQCCNPLYWQGSVRSQLKKTCESIRVTDEIYTLIPEAMGVDVIATMKPVGIDIVFPAYDPVRKVAIVGRTLP